MRNLILSFAILGLVFVGTGLALNGPVKSRVYTGTTSGVTINVNPITSGSPTYQGDKIAYVGCADDAFQVLAWQYTGSDFKLVFPAVADTSTSGALANQFIRVEGKFDFLVVKTATGSYSVSYQLYEK